MDLLPSSSSPTNDVLPDLLIPPKPQPPLSQPRTRRPLTMFDKLTQSLSTVFKNLRGHGKLTETNIRDALREIRLALLEADVNFQVVKDFIQRVESKTLGEKTIEGVNPGQQFIKRVHDELAALLGGETRTSTGAEQAGHGDDDRPARRGQDHHLRQAGPPLARPGKKVMLVGCDIRRPAAVEQLGVLAKQAGVNSPRPTPASPSPTSACAPATSPCARAMDVVLFDTGGRFQIDDDLVQELADLKSMVNPKNVIMVVDAAMGQESVNITKTFPSEGGPDRADPQQARRRRPRRALHVHPARDRLPRAAGGRGREQEDLEPFHPDRMASRILGMGDVVSLMKKPSSPSTRTPPRRWRRSSSATR